MTGWFYVLKPEIRWMFIDVYFFQLPAQTVAQDQKDLRGRSQLQAGLLSLTRRRYPVVFVTLSCNHFQFLIHIDYKLQ